MLNFSVTFLITIVNITFLYLVLKRVLFKPVTKFMENRANGIQNDLDAVKRASARAEALEAEFEEKMKNSYAEGQKILQASRDKAEQEYARIIEKAHVDAEKIMQAGRENLEEERRHAERMLREEAASLSIQAASRVITANLDTEKNRKLVEKFIETVGVA